MTGEHYKSLLLHPKAVIRTQAQLCKMLHEHIVQRLAGLWGPILTRLEDVLNITHCLTDV